MSSNVSAAVTELLATRIDSFEKLEIVIALHAAPRGTMTVDSLCLKLAFTRETVRQAAMDLRASSLVEMTSRGEVQLLPITIRDQQVVDELARLYSEDRFAVVTALGEIGLDKIRTIAARAFADAILIRKKKDGDDG